MIFGRTKAELRAKREERRTKTGRFAWIPVWVDGGRWLWLERYTWVIDLGCGSSTTYRYRLES